MSQDFNLKFDEFQENDPTQPAGTDKQGNYPASSHARSVCFVWPDGKMMSLNYSYLISIEYDADDNQIILSFTTHKVTVKGSQLKGLFSELLLHIPKFVVCINQRYNATREKDDMIINEIIVIENPF